MRKSTHTPEYAALCAEIRTARKSAGLSQRDLASRLAVPPSWVSKVETGERRLDLVEFCWVVSTCGIDPLPLFKRLAAEIARRSSTPKKARGGQSK
ncbi:MAG: helix-turn-helix transcriptional regulator [Planctomycetia bacterium]|nr:helix-turn-helix transcriptional regulator [Planctomycetia bacterium]